MEATIVRSLRVISLTVFLACPLQHLQAGSARTQNFIVTAPTTALAKEIAHEAERFRKELSISWLGQELPPWSEPCPVQADVNPRKGAGGATSFVFEMEQRHFARPVGDGLFQAKPPGRAMGWEMTLQGSRERILDSVLPHEVTHTIFATYFGRPLPRWADEGACTTVEHESEKAKQHKMLYEFLTTNRGIAFNDMFSMTEYPAQILPLYSQGYSLTRYLIQQGGRRKFVDYIGEGLDSNNWTEATKQHYGYESISDLQVTWLDWVRNGGRPVPPRRSQGATLIASHSDARGSNRGSQSELVQSSWTPVSSSGSGLALSATAPRQPQRLAAGESWYSQQKSTSASQATTSRGVSPGATRRTASRTNQGDERREVILEWGEPRTFSNPSLASRNQVDTQR